MQWTPAKNTKRSEVSEGRAIMQAIAVARGTAAKVNARPAPLMALVPVAEGQPMPNQCLPPSVSLRSIAAQMPKRARGRPRGLVKPRLRLGVRAGSWGNRRWMCACFNYSARGTTPLEAFNEWLKKRATP